MLLHALLLGVLPAAAVLLTRPLPALGWRRGLLRRAGFLLAMALLAAGALGVSSQGVFSLMRSDPALRYRITPGNYIVSLVRVLKPSKTRGPLQVVGADARRPP